MGAPGGAFSEASSPLLSTVVGRMSELSALSSALPSLISSFSMSRFYELFHYYCLRPGGGADFARLLQVPILIACALYLPVIYTLQWYMKDRRPYKMKAFCFLWNLSLSVLSSLGFFIILFTQPELIPRAIYPERDFLPPVRAVICLFTLTKAVEFGDTLILVLKKKPLVFLHVYHHLTVALYCWHAQLVSVSMGHNFAFINLGIHGVMYLYYAASVVCPGFYILKICRPYITILQTTQMFVGLFLSYEALVYSPHLPEKEVLNIYLACFMYASYFFLFGKFFVEAYMNHLRPKTTQLVVGVHVLALGGLWIIWNSKHPYHILLEVLTLSSITALVVPLAYKAFLKKGLSQFSSYHSTSRVACNDSMMKTLERQLQHSGRISYTEKEKAEEAAVYKKMERGGCDVGARGDASEKDEGVGKAAGNDQCCPSSKNSNADAETDVSSTDSSPLSTANERSTTDSATAPTTPTVSSSTPSSIPVTSCGQEQRTDEEETSALTQRKTRQLSADGSPSLEHLSEKHGKVTTAEEKSANQGKPHHASSSRNAFSQLLLTTMNFLLAWALEAMTSAAFLLTASSSCQSEAAGSVGSGSGTPSSCSREEKDTRERPQDGVSSEEGRSTEKTEMKTRAAPSEAQVRYHLFDALFALISKPPQSQKKKSPGVDELKTTPCKTNASLSTTTPSVATGGGAEDKRAKDSAYLGEGPLGSFADILLLLISFALPTVYGWYVHGSAILGLCGLGAFRWIVELYLCHTILRRNRGRGKYVKGNMTAVTP